MTSEIVYFNLDNSCQDHNNIFNYDYFTQQQIEGYFSSNNISYCMEDSVGYLQFLHDSQRYDDNNCQQYEQTINDLPINDQYQQQKNLHVQEKQCCSCKCHCDKKSNEQDNIKQYGIQKKIISKPAAIYNQNQSLNQSQKNNPNQKKRRETVKNKIQQIASQETKNLFVLIVPIIEKTALEFYPHLDKINCLKTEKKKSLAYLNDFLLECVDNSQHIPNFKDELSSTVTHILNNYVYKSKRHENFYMIKKYLPAFTVIIQNPGIFESIKDALKIFQKQIESQNTSQ